MVEIIRTLRDRVEAYEPVDHWRNDSFDREAAVLIAVTESLQPEIVLTKRSETLSSHRGEVALPGGKKDDTDDDFVFTALRETHEEVGLHPDKVEVLGTLDTMVTRFGVKITPVVGLIPHEVDLVPNPVELDSVFRVPVDFFLQDKRQRTDIGTVGGHKVQVPCWEFEGYEIWGVTAVILVMMMNRVFDMNIETGMEKLPQGTGGNFRPQDWRPVQGKKGITE